MTTSTKTETKTFTICYSIRSTYIVEVERDANITKDELLNSITKDELIDGEGSGDWDALKDAWREGDVNGIFDENSDDAFSN